MTNCGASAESCCTALAVTGGTFDRTYTNTGSGPTATADPATVSDFRLDKYEVTVGRFRRFVQAWNGGAGWLPPVGSGKHVHLNGGLGLVNSGAVGTYEAGWDAAYDAYVAPTDNNLLNCPGGSTWTSSPGPDENLPLTCATWHEAYAFCIWDGGFLASEAEWEYAAAAGAQLREYPWGSTDPGAQNQYAIYNSDFNGGVTAPVGTAALGATQWGQLDLAGNVDEWVLDWDVTYGACTDCAFTGSSQVSSSWLRVHRGGNTLADTTALYPSTRGADDPAARGYTQGFRCARTP
jgi:formylglycine-generating enzyme required for sulfatase activity